jgi:hypothetical protein
VTSEVILVSGTVMVFSSETNVARVEADADVSTVGVFGLGWIHVEAMGFGTFVVTSATEPIAMKRLAAIAHVASIARRR